MASAEWHLEAALQEAIKCGDPDALVRAYNGQAVIFRHSGKTDRAMKASQHARDLLDEITDESLQGFVYSAYASLLMNMGRFNEADEAFRSAENWHRKAGAELRAAACMGERARMAMHAGRPDTAATLFKQSMAVVRSHDDAATFSRLLINLGILQAQAGRVDRAESMYREALTVVKRVGDLRSEGILLELLANLHTKRLNKQAAEDLYRQALQIHRETDNLRAQGNCLGNLGALFVSFGEIEKGEQYLNQALALHRQVQNLHGEGGHLCSLGVAYLCRAKVQLARETWQQGIQILQSHGIAGLDQATVQRMREECTKLGIEPLPVPDSAVPKRP
jgi:tetratricopeptide (TPR) repeat protein